MDRLVRCTWLLAGLLCACEPSTAGVNTNTKIRQYAGIRVLNLLADVTSMDTVVAVTSDLPSAFAGIPAPGVSPFQQTSVGPSTAYLSIDETTTAASTAQMTTAGERFTVVESGFTAAGQTPAATLQWIAETAPQVPAGQAMARFVLGAPAAAGADVKLGAVDFTSAAVLGALSQWTAIDPASSSLTLTVGATTTTFTLQSLAAGDLHTYAVVVGPADVPLRLVDITEKATGDGVAAAPVPPTSP